MQSHCGVISFVFQIILFVLQFYFFRQRHKAPPHDDTVYYVWKTKSKFMSLDNELICVTDPVLWWMLLSIDSSSGHSVLFGHAFHICASFFSPPKKHSRAEATRWSSSIVTTILYLPIQNWKWTNWISCRRRNISGERNVVTQNPHDDGAMCIVMCRTCANNNASILRLIDEGMKRGTGDGGEHWAQ